jgi:uncharacterized protein involved in outer membrane biogenesis
MSATATEIEIFMRLPVFLTILFLLVAQIILLALPMLVALQPTRAELEQLIGQRLNQQVAIEGDIQLRFLPRPQIIFHDTQLTAKSDDQLLDKAHVARTIVDLSWGGLGELQFDIGRLTLEGAQLEASVKTNVSQLVGSWNEAKLPPVDLIKVRLSLSGLNKARRDLAFTLGDIDGDIQTVGFGSALQLRLRHNPASGVKTHLNLRLGDGRRRSSVDFGVGSENGDAVTFSGFVRRGENWRADGELGVTSTGNLAQSLAALYGYEVTANGRATALRGLISVDANRLTSENLQVSSLDTAFQTRLTVMWPNSEMSRPLVAVRAATGFVDVSQIRPSPANRQARAQSFGPNAASDGLSLVDVWRSFFKTTDGLVRLEADRFTFAGETGRDLIIAVAPEQEIVELQRLSADLPFRSSVLGAGKFVVNEAGTQFEGTFSARSSDALGMAIWLGNLTGQDFSPFVENVDEARLQRVSFVSDVVWSPDVFELQGLSGRIGDDQVQLDLSLPQSAQQRGALKLRLARFDLADWGLSASANSNSRDYQILSGIPVNRLLALGFEAGQRRPLSLKLDFDQLYNGARSFGPMAFDGVLKSQGLGINQLTLSAYDNAQLSFSGDLQTDGPDGSDAHGRLKMRMRSQTPQSLLTNLSSRLAPFSVNLDAPLEIAGEWYVAARNAADWPRVRFQGDGQLGTLALDVDFETPDRQFNFAATGSTRIVALQGRADELAERLNMPVGYDPAARGKLDFKLITETSTISEINAAVQLQDDNFAFVGAIRPDAAGPRIDGQLQMRGTQLLVLALETAEAASQMQFDGRSQIIMTRQGVSFSGLDLALGDGRLSGEGRYTNSDNKQSISANLVIDGLNVDWLLPRYHPQDGWSQGDMKWSILERNADLDLRFSALSVGGLLVDKLATRLRVRDGVLEAPEVTASLFGGEATGQLQAEGGTLTPAFNLSARVGDVQIGQVFQALYDETLVDAGVAGGLTMRGRGRSAYDMIKSLSGTANLEASSGDLTFINLSALDGLDEGVEEFNDAAEGLYRAGELDGSTGFERGLSVLNLREGLLEVGAADIVFAAPRPDGKLALEMDLLTRNVQSTLTLFANQSGDALILGITGAAPQPKLSYQFFASSIADPSEPSQTLDPEAALDAVLDAPIEVEDSSDAPN